MIIYNILCEFKVIEILPIHIVGILCCLPLSLDCSLPSLAIVRPYNSIPFFTLIEKNNNLILLNLFTLLRKRWRDSTRAGSRRSSGTGHQEERPRGPSWCLLRPASRSQPRHFLRALRWTRRWSCWCLC